VFFNLLEENKIKINMVILVFRGNKNEGLETFLREYKRACINMGVKATTKWFNFFFEFLK
jgi:hypothetical protein